MLTNKVYFLFKSAFKCLLGFDSDGLIKPSEHYFQRATLQHNSLCTQSSSIHFIGKILNGFYMLFTNVDKSIFAFNFCSKLYVICNI